MLVLVIAAVAALLGLRYMFIVIYAPLASGRDPTAEHGRASKFQVSRKLKCLIDKSKIEHVHNLNEGYLSNCE